MTDSASIFLVCDGPVAQVTISHPARRNAMTRAMWRELRQVFLQIRDMPDLRCVLLQGQGEQFCAGGDISEYPSFRFDPGTLGHFHEIEVWGALQAILDCDLPVVAAVQGACMGGGLEIACCADLRLASHCARFGAPIGRLGFPMAPKELHLLQQALGSSVARAMVLGGAVLDGSTLLAAGFLTDRVDPLELAPRVAHWIAGLCQQSPQATRANKQALRMLEATPGARSPESAYDYAPHPEHREGVLAFLEGRKPVF